MPELGVHCQAIMESRHVDVIEMDAASHTGIDDVREIIENARYRPVSARTKVYIIDEVHMLSKQAFNGLSEDARRAARARQVSVRDHRDRQGADHRALALHPFRSATHRVGADDRPLAQDLRRRRGRRRARGAGADRPRRRRLGARRAVAARPGHRPWRSTRASPRKPFATCSASPTGARSSRCSSG